MKVVLRKQAAECFPMELTGSSARVGGAVHVLRIKKNLTLKELAQAAHISEAAAAKIELGDFDFAASTQEVEAICGILGKTVDQLVQYSQRELLPSDPVKARKKMDLLFED